jgi:hypothetical protein
MRPATLALLMTCLSPLPAGATDDRGNLSGVELRAMISGATVTGRHDTGMPYSEWHAPSGQVYGHNNHDPNDEACWDIRGDAVCYYYAGGANRGTFCWTFRRVSENGYRLRSVENGVQASGIRQAGNPYNFTDNGKPWSCEPLSSQNHTPRPGGPIRQAAR